MDFQRKSGFLREQQFAVGIPILIAQPPLQTFGSLYREENKAYELGCNLTRNCWGMGYATEAAKAVRDWTFRNTPFNVVYSYMKHTNEPSARTAMAYGCRLMNTFADEQNGITRVNAISRKQWQTLQGGIPSHK